MPKVSFILPAYKKTFLKEAINSILSQSFRDFELVIVDDASPENLKELVDLFSDDRISYHKNDQNLGGKSLVAAWTHAMTYATGEFCVLASDDDIYLPDYLKEMIHLSEKYPDVDIFHCRTGNIDFNSNITNIGDCHYEYETCLEYLCFRGVRRYVQAAPDFMFRISTWKAIGGFVDFPVAFFSDDATWYSLALKNGIACSKKMLFLFRESGINVSGSKGNIYPKVEATLAFMKWSENFLEKISCSDEEEHTLKEYVRINLFQTSRRFLLDLTRDASFSELLRILKHLEMPNKVIRNQVIKQRITMIIEGIIRFLSLRRLYH